MVSFLFLCLLSIIDFDISADYITYWFYSKKLNAKLYTLVERMP